MERVTPHRFRIAPGVTTSSSGDPIAFGDSVRSLLDGRDFGGVATSVPDIRVVPWNVLCFSA